jgi:hypothetical protein
MPLVNLRKAVQAALRDHATHILQWLNYIPRTNEIGRSAELIATALMLERRFNQPLIVSELGASAGLNLLFDRFALSSFGFTYQPHKATLTLTPDWRGPAPPPGRFQIAGRSGVDLSPINPRSSEGFLRLCAYTWPDQTERLQQLARICPRQRVAIAQGDAADWLRLRLASGYPKHLHLVFNTVAWHYFSLQTQQNCMQAPETAGQQASSATPLAHFAMEADDQGLGAALRLTLWPDEQVIELGRADFHGRWIAWAGNRPFKGLS